MRNATSGRGVRPVIAVFVTSAVTLAALFAIRPHLTGNPTTWPGDDLAFAAMWLGAVVGAAWLGLVTLACLVAIGAGAGSHAARVAGWAPPLARRILQTALVGTWALVPATAYAAAPSPPVVVHVDPHGRLEPDAGSRARPPDEPVVRAPRKGTTSTTQPTATTTRIQPVDAPRPAPPASVPHRVAAQPGPPRSRTYLVGAGDNLWRIARAEVARATGDTDPRNRTVARYWQRVIAANRATLRSGDPSLIFPGEVVNLPDAGGV